MSTEAELPARLPLFLTDADVARAYGSRSPGRARRLLAYMEERQVIVCRLDPRGRRIVAIPGLAWETEPGDPNAPAGAAAAVRRARIAGSLHMAVRDRGG